MTVNVDQNIRNPDAIHVRLAILDIQIVENVNVT